MPNLTKEDIQKWIDSKRKTLREVEQEDGTVYHSGRNKRSEEYRDAKFRYHASYLLLHQLNALENHFGLVDPPHPIVIEICHTEETIDG